MKRPLFACTLCIIFGYALFAVTTSYYEESGIRDFESGQFEGIAIDDNGELSLAPETRTLLDKEELFVWDLARGKNGEVFASTGVKGNIWRVAPDGRESLLAGLGASAVYSIAAAPDGRVFAALSGPARIVAIDANGKQTPLAQLGNSYIWKLLYGSDGKLYAACGNPATLERIDSTSGRVERLYAAQSEAHFLAMAEDRAGNIYLGSEGRGTLYRRAKNGQVKAMYNAYEEEIACITTDAKGRVYFGTSSQRRLITSSNFDYENDSIEMREREQRRQEAIERDEEESGEGKAKKKPHKNSVYRLNLDESVEKVFTLSDTSFYSLALDASGTLYVGSGELGVLYGIDASGKSSRVLRVDGGQILCLLADGAEILAGTGNDGLVYAITHNKQLSGTYTSRALDCLANVAFGAFSWNALVPKEASIAFSTRSGNTNPVDETWSEWSEPYTRASGVQITSPRARYVQYRAEMRAPSLAASPRLYSLRIPFVHDNRAPRVRAVSVTTYAEAKITKKAKLNPGQALLTWQSEDDDNDTLEQTVYFRVDGDPAWRILRIDAQQNQALLNSEILPDGWYQFRVAASDRPSNPDILAKTAHADSRRVLIDNTPPVIKLGVRNLNDSVIITGTVQDTHSPIAMIRYSLNAEDWVYVPPEDEIFDSMSESVYIRLPLKDDAHLLDGRNILFVRACDHQENWTTAQILFDARLPEGALGRGNERRYLHQD